MPHQQNLHGSGMLITGPTVELGTTAPLGETVLNFQATTLNRTFDHRTTAKPYKAEYTIEMNRSIEGLNLCQLPVEIIRYIIEDASSGLVQ